MRADLAKTTNKQMLDNVLAVQSDPNDPDDELQSATTLMTQLSTLLEIQPPPPPVVDSNSGNSTLRPVGPNSGNPTVGPNSGNPTVGPNSTNHYYQPMDTVPACNSRLSFDGTLFYVYKHHSKLKCLKLWKCD